jgi:Protein of unknown function (DUF3276)
MPEEFQKPVYSQSMKAGGKTYFFDVKQARGEKGGKYLLVSETRLDKGIPVRNHITVFPDHLSEFCQVLETVKEKV